MLYSCTHVATVGINGLKVANSDWNTRYPVSQVLWYSKMFCWISARLGECGRDAIHVGCYTVALTPPSPSAVLQNVCHCVHKVYLSYWHQPPATDPHTAMQQLNSFSNYIAFAINFYTSPREAALSVAPMSVCPSVYVSDWLEIRNWRNFKFSADVTNTSEANLIWGYRNWG